MAQLDGKRSGPGRPKGTPNKTTAALKEAILLAAEQTGRDGNGKEGITGYCRHLAVTEPKAFAALMGKVLPMQHSGEGGGPVKMSIRWLMPGESDDAS